MSLLLDTHVVLWWLTDDPTLSDDIKTKLDHDPDVRISAATIWEVTIKQAIGKLVERPTFQNESATADSSSYPSRSSMPSPPASFR